MKALLGEDLVQADRVDESLEARAQQDDVQEVFGFFSTGLLLLSSAQLVSCRAYLPANAQSVRPTYYREVKQALLAAGDEVSEL